MGFGITLCKFIAYSKCATLVGDIDKENVIDKDVGRVTCLTLEIGKMLLCRISRILFIIVHYR